MKHKDFKPCHICGNGIAHEGYPLFLRITVERFGLNRKAIERAHGMELLMGGNAGLANIMGPDENLAEKIDENRNMLVCGGCAQKALQPYFWLESLPTPPMSETAKEE